MPGTRHLLGTAEGKVKVDKSKAKIVAANIYIYIFVSNFVSRFFLFRPPPLDPSVSAPSFVSVVSSFTHQRDIGLLAFCFVVIRVRALLRLSPFFCLSCLRSGLLV